MQKIFIRLVVASLSVFFIGGVTVSAMVSADSNSPSQGIILAQSYDTTSFQTTSLPTDTDPNGGVSTCVALTYNMSFGSKDSRTEGQVSDLQFYLQDKGYLTSEPTGYFGYATKRAVQAFQTANGINPNGNVGPMTRAKIKALSCGFTASSQPTQPTYTTQTAQVPTTQASPNPSGMINLDSTVCTIPVGQSQCGAKISWNVTNPVAGKTEFVISGGFDYTIRQDSYPSTMFMNKIGENVAKYVLKNNGIVLDTETITSTCAQGSSWNGSVCAGTAASVPSITGVVISQDGLGNIQGTSFNPLFNTVTINRVTKQLTTSANGQVIPFSVKDFNLVSGTTYFVQVQADYQKSTLFSFYVPVLSSPFGSITLDSPTCTIPAGQSQCGAKLSWNVTNGVAGKTQFIIAGGFSYTMTQDSYPTTNFMNGKGENVSTYTLKNNGVTLDTKTVTSKCAAGTTWNGSICQTDPTAVSFPTASITISAAGYGTNVHTITYPVGTPNTKNWTSTNGTSFTSYAWRTGNCTNRTSDEKFIWNGTPAASGVSNGVGNAGDVGCVVHINFTATNSAGSATDEIAVTVTNPALMVDSMGDVIINTNAAIVSAAKKAVATFSGATQASAMSCVSLNSNLHRGFETGSVTKLQEFLVEKGLLKEKPSGFFGDLTIAAVKSYQKSLGLKETGMVYDATREAIKMETCGI